MLEWIDCVGHRKRSTVSKGVWKELRRCARSGMLLTLGRGFWQDLIDRPALGPSGGGGLGTG